MNTIVFAVCHMEANKILARSWWYRKAITWRSVYGCVRYEWRSKKNFVIIKSACLAQAIATCKKRHDVIFNLINEGNYNFSEIAVITKAQLPDVR